MLKHENCLIASNSNLSWLWHKKLGHASMSLIDKLARKKLVRGLPNISFKNDHVCDTCMKGKQTRLSFKSINSVSTARPLKLLHLDLFGPMRTQSLGGKSYTLVIVDNFSRFTWVLFLGNKGDAFKVFSRLC